MKTIFYNAVVYTGQLPLQQAFAVEGEKFTFCGTNAEALALCQSEDALIDLQGAFVCPGFNDSHMHLLNFGRSLRNPRLDQHTNSLADMLCCLKDFDEANPGTGWIVGRGWNQDYFTDVSRMPNRHDLDKVSTTRPVCAVRACGHALAVNSFALALLGITGEMPQPDGGEIVMEQGLPNGIFLDSAMDLVYASISAPDKQEIRDMILAACKALNAYGVTSSQSDDYCVFSGLPWETVNEAYQELAREGQLTVRVYEQCNFTNLNDLQAFLDTGFRTGTGDSWFRIGPLKMLGDGALGPRTAFLSRPYADKPDTTGIPVFSQETFDGMIGCAHKNGMQVAIHAIGDACLDRVLSAINKAHTANPREDHRHGIVHCQITRPDQLEEILRQKLHVYAQTIFLDYDIGIVKERAGEDLAKTSYSWKTLLRSGGTVSNGTDCPVELPFAMGGIQCAVTRKNLRGDLVPYLPGEAFTLDEALFSYTAAGAWSSFEEREKGKIQPGMLADFVILESNPFAVPEKRISQIPVLQTWVGGRQVFCREKC